MVIYGMDRGTVQIDAAGRLVLPKPVRKKLNLTPGDKLRFAADEKGIHLEPVHHGGQLVRKGTMLVFYNESGETVTNEMVQQMIEEDRDRLVRDLQFKSRKK
jgi:AbrB family looped-hinge helix DNA binding protein